MNHLNHGNQVKEASETQPARRIKCIVWDLDNTLWNGTLLEGDHVTPCEGVVEVIAELDRRGILHSIASRNDRATALRRLSELGLDHYFLHPQIGWGAKSEAVARVAESIGIGIDTLAFIDDQPYELAEVLDTHAEVLCLPSTEIGRLLERAEFQPRFTTSESARRREMYRSAIVRDEYEHAWEGARSDFLKSLEMHFRIQPASEDDLQRAEELTVRTHQLNTSGRTYSYEELRALSQDPGWLLLVASLDDRFGSYGKIGLALIQLAADEWTIKLLLMSCRVISRGVGSLLITHVRKRARAAGVRLLAEFVPSEVNQGMYTTYRFNRFSDVGRRGNCILMQNDLSDVAEYPDYLSVVEGAARGG